MSGLLEWLMQSAVHLLTGRRDAESDSIQWRRPVRWNGETASVYGRRRRRPVYHHDWRSARSTGRRPAVLLRVHWTRLPSCVRSSQQSPAADLAQERPLQGRPVSVGLAKTRLPQRLLSARSLRGEHNYTLFLAHFYSSCLQCFDSVGWAAGRASGL